MRIHIDRETMRIIRALGEAGQPARRRIESLLQEPYPADARAIEDEPGTFEVFEAGYWIGYTVDKSDPGETVIKIWQVEAN